MWKTCVQILLATCNVLVIVTSAFVGTRQDLCSVLWAIVMAQCWQAQLQVPSDEPPAVCCGHTNVPALVVHLRAQGIGLVLWVFAAAHELMRQILMHSFIPLFTFVVTCAMRV